MPDQGKDNCSSDEVLKFTQLLHFLLNYMPGSRIDGHVGTQLPNDFPKWARIGVFGQFSAGKSSFLNNLLWVLGYEKSTEFKMIFPSCKRTAAMGGHTSGMQPADISPSMKFIDTRGFPEVNSEVCKEIRRICEGYRSFRESITWEKGFCRSIYIAIRDFIYWLFFSSWREANKLDFAILVIKGQVGGPSISIRDRVVPVADVIKSTIGRHPVVVITAKDSMTDEDRTIFETSLHGFGIPRVVFIENYLIEDNGTTPKHADIKMEKHKAFLDVLDVLQMEYDGWLRAQYELDAKAFERSKKNRRHQHED